MGARRHISNYAKHRVSEAFGAEAARNSSEPSIGLVNVEAHGSTALPIALTRVFIKLAGLRGTHSQAMKPHCYPLAVSHRVKTNGDGREQFIA